MIYHALLTVIISFTLIACGGGDNEVDDLLTIVAPESVNDLNDLVNDLEDLADDDADSETTNATITLSDDDPMSVVTGRVIDAITGESLTDVLVTITSNSIELTARTDASGIYILPGVPVSSAATANFNLSGYLTEQFGNLNLADDNTTVLDAVSLVSNDNSGSGTIAGSIISALDGQGVAGLTLNFRRGINAVTGPIVATTETDAAGNYSVSNIEYGNVTCEIVGVGFTTTYATVLALGNIVQSNQSASISPSLNTGELRIVLTWGASPSDLDSHLTGPIEGSDDYFHVNFANRTTELANLDLDDTSAFGPETITVERQLNGIYRYTVHNFGSRNVNDLSASQARVQLLGENGLIEEFFVPAGQGNLWTVFDLQGGLVTPINTINQRDSARLDHFPPNARGTQGALRKVDARQLLK